MKKCIAFILVCLLLAGCGAPSVDTTAPTQETTKATEAAQPSTETQTPESEAPETTVPPTEADVTYSNPLTGEPASGPQTKRLFAVTINDLEDALPRVGVVDADIYMEMFVNGSIVRGIALYTDAASVPKIGSVRSTRFMFNDLAMHYDFILAHAGGSAPVLANAKARGVDGFNVDTQDSTDYSFRDKDRTKAGYGWEHVLFVKGEGLEAKAISEGISVDADPNKDYNLRFRADGTPEGGENATTVDVTLTYHDSRKQCLFLYDESLGKYVYNQYGKEMVDGTTGEKESYENVIVMFSKMTMNADGYQETKFENGGDGYYACGGKLVPITWGCDGENSPFWFKNTDGSTLEMGEGRTFIVITDVGSAVKWN